MRTFLLDPNSLLEFLLNRSNFIGKVEYLSTIFRHNSGIQLYLSQPGLDKIVSLIKPLNGLKKTEQLVTKLKKRIKILRLTKAVAEKAKLSSINYDSAVEIYLAIKKNIDAIVTHQPDNFLSEELSIITLSDLQLNHLELSLLKNINDLPAILVTPLDKIFNLNRVFHLPSHIIVKPLKLKKYTHQLDLTCSSDKVSSPSGDNSSPRSTNARSIQQVILDALSQPVFNRSTAYSNVLKYNSLATGHLAHEKHLDDLRKSIFGDIQKHSNALFAAGKEHSSLVARLSSQSKTSQLINQADLVKLRDLATESLTLGSLYNGLNTGVARISEIQSSLVGRLSIKPPLTQSIAHPDTAQFGNLAASMQVGNSLLVNRLLPEPLVAQSAGKIDFLKSSDIPTNVIKSSKGFSDDLIKGVLQDGKAHSSLVDRLSIKPILARSTAQANVAKISSLMPENLACKSSLKASRESIIDRERLLPQPLLARSTGKIDVLKSDTLAIACRASKNHHDNLTIGIFRDFQLHSSLAARLAPQSTLDRLIPQTNISKLNSLAAEHLALKSSIVGLNVDVCQFSKIKSSLVDSLSIEPKIFARSIAQLDAARSSGLATERLTCTSSLDTLKESIDRANQINPLLNMERSYSDRSGVFSQIKLLESMEKANTLKSYLSRKN